MSLQAHAGSRMVKAPTTSPEKKMGKTSWDLLRIYILGDKYIIL